MKTDAVIKQEGISALISKILLVYPYSTSPFSISIYTFLYAA